VGDDIFLVDAKRAGLNSAHLMGDPDACRRLEDDVGHGCEQILATYQAIKEGTLGDTLEQLGVPRSWRPRRVVPLVITHRPVFLFFSSMISLLERRGLTREWDVNFTACPLVWALADLELFEAALPHLDLERFVGSVVRREPTTASGVPSYLDAVSYTGMIASPYYEERRHEILAPFVAAIEGNS
jgi:hypothetical protein